MRYSYILIFSLLFLSGCAGTEIKVNPGVKSVPSSYTQPRFEKVVINSLSTSGGSFTDGFAASLEESGFAKSIYYPVRSDDKTDIILDTQFKLTSDEHSGSAFAKSFFTGLTLFLIKPFIWYDVDYRLEGSALISKNGNRVGKVNAQTDATISVKWLNLGDIKSLSQKALEEAQQSVYRQMMRKVHWYI